ncbi:WD40 repeat-like protein [Myriangium duriaei CBS 260.36]|uniref:WD40 repeat-like protein n=1 Tax=Myriangium duriaei CBS 260.36 TaxID=1168546 RepID=A0A9P4J5L7_9PEZI|nr:WD40 repeat-like protein [Myriangium duriaei CBS 260.36]
MPSYSRDKFLEEFELSLDKEFEWKGSVAKWAPGHDGPRFWGDEDDLIQPGDNDDDKSTRMSSEAVLTSDGLFLAVSSRAIIEIYDMESFALCSRIIGPENDVQKLFFIDKKDVSKAEDHSYILFSENADVSGRDGKIYTWFIDSHGFLRRDLRIAPLPVEAMSTEASATISRRLIEEHGLDPLEIELIRKGFLEALKSADSRNRVKHLPSHNGHFPHFNAQPISHDGTRTLHIVHGETTQHGMRPPDELPQIIVMDIATGKEKCRLRGHEDAIMWAGWSLDDKVIATAAWDQFYMLWDADSGKCLHVIGATGGQNWAGAFLPDGTHVLLSGGQPVEVAIFNVETAEKVTTLSPPEGVKLDHWMRYFTVHPTENLIIIQNGLTLLAWRPAIMQSQASGPEVEEIFALTPDSERLKNTFNNVTIMQWADDGRKLLAKGSDSTDYVWDVDKNLKWRFQRPKGRKCKVYGGEVILVKRKDGQWIVSLDGDGRVRLWKMEP